MTLALKRPSVTTQTLKIRSPLPQTRLIDIPHPSRLLLPTQYTQCRPLSRRSVGAVDIGQPETERPHTERPSKRLDTRTLESTSVDDALSSDGGGFRQCFQDFALQNGFLVDATQTGAVAVLHEMLELLPAQHEVFEAHREAAVKTLCKQAADESVAPASSTGFWRLLGRVTAQPTAKPSKKSAPDVSQARRKTKGAYLYGPAGQGKTVLLDLIASHVVDTHLLAADAVLRCHFHHFMTTLQRMLHLCHGGHFPTNMPPLRDLVEECRNDKAFGIGASYAPGGGSASDMIAGMSDRIVAEGLFLVLLDEFQVTNISDALILKRLFESLFERGIMLVCTSNCPIDQLYEGGLNRDRFLPFMSTLRSNVLELNLDSKQDFRTVNANKSDWRTTFSAQEVLHEYAQRSELRASAVKDARHALSIISPGRDKQNLINQLIALKLFPKSAPDTALKLANGRHLKVDLMNEAKHMICVSFEDLCQGYRAPSDYITLSKAAASGLWIHSIPVLDAGLDKETLRRFVNVIDIIYDDVVPIVLDMARPPLRIIKGHHDYSAVGLDRLLLVGTKRFETLSAAWKSAFPTTSPLISYQEWLDATLDIGLSLTEATAIWDVCPRQRQGLMSQQGLRTLLLFYFTYGLAPSSFWTGDFFQEEEPSPIVQAPVITSPEVRQAKRALQFLLGSAKKSDFELAVKTAGDAVSFWGKQEAIAESSEVSFAIPRLLSRLCQLQNGYRDRHPLLLSTI